MSGGSWARDGRPWCATISLTRRVGTLPLKTEEDASLSGENGLLWSNLHRRESQTPDFGFVVVGATNSPAPLCRQPCENAVSSSQITGDDFDEDGVEQNWRGRRR